MMLVAGLASAIVIGLAIPAWAHHAIVSGQTSCSDADNAVTWSIGNSESNHVMTIASISAKVGAVSYAVTGYTNPVGDSGSTTAHTTVPAGVTGTVVLSLHVTWSDNYQADASTSVLLKTNCTAPTTTSTSTSTTTAPTTTSTTIPPTTTSTTVAPTTTSTSTSTSTTSTTVPPTSTSTSTTSTSTSTTSTTVPTTVEGSTTIVTTTTVPTTVQDSTTIATTTSPVTAAGTTQPTTPVAPLTLPHTGTGSGFAALFGLSCLGAGALLLMRQRRNWSKP